MFDVFFFYQEGKYIQYVFKIFPKIFLKYIYSITLIL